MVHGGWWMVSSPYSIALDPGGSCFGAADLHHDHGSPSLRWSGLAAWHRAAVAIADGVVAGREDFHARSGELVLDRLEQR